MLLALLLALAADPPAPAPVLPIVTLDTPDWSIARGAEGCKTKVALANGVHLVLGYHPGRDLTYVALVDPALAREPGGWVNATLRIGSTRETVLTGVGPYSAQELRPTLNFLWARTPARLQRLAAAGRITITGGGRPAIAYNVPGARTGIAQLLACAAQVSRART